MTVGQPATPPIVFLSYLRASGGAYARAVYVQLRAHLREEEIFFDVAPNDIPAGSDWAEVLERAMAGVQVVLAIVDPDWERQMSSAVRRRFRRRALPYMCEEIRMALALQTHVIPLLMGGAAMPTSQRLPGGAAELVRMQGFPVSDDYWEASFERLVPTLRSFRDRQFEVIASMLTDDERARLAQMDPRSRARYLLQRKIEERAKKTALTSQLQQMRHQMAMEMIQSVR